MTVDRRPVVIAGLPRSGTTWTMRVLATTPGGRAVFEADNEDKFPSSIHSKRRLGRYPVLSPGDAAPAYRHLWAWILEGAYEGARSRRARQILGPGVHERIFEGKPDLVTWLASTLARDPSLHARPAGVPEPRCVVAKSIHLQLCLEWVVSEFDVRPLVLLRHPANVLASWMEVKIKDTRNSTLETRPDIRARYVDPLGIRLPGPDPVERMCWRIGLLITALEDALSRHPEWVTRSHEQLCTDPTSQFRSLFADLGLEWTEATADYLAEHDTPGEGMTLNRVASEVSGSWQKRLDDEQLATLRRVLGWFPVTTWTDGDFERTTTDS